VQQVQRIKKYIFNHTIISSFVTNDEIMERIEEWCYLWWKKWQKKRRRNSRRREGGDDFFLSVKKSFFF